MCIQQSDKATYQNFSWMKNGTRHFFKARVEKKANKTPLAVLDVSYSIAGLWFMFSFPLPFKWLMSCASKAELERINDL